MSKLSKACHKQNREENRFALFYDGVVSDLAQNKNFPCFGQNLSDFVAKVGENCYNAVRHTT